MALPGAPEGDPPPLHAQAVRYRLHAGGGAAGEQVVIAAASTRGPPPGTPCRPSTSKAADPGPQAAQRPPDWPRTRTPARADGPSAARTGRRYCSAKACGLPACVTNGWPTDLPWTGPPLQQSAAQTIEESPARRWPPGTAAGAPLTAISRPVWRACFTLAAPCVTSRWTPALPPWPRPCRLPRARPGSGLLHTVVMEVAVITKPGAEGGAGPRNLLRPAAGHQRRRRLSRATPGGPHLLLTWAPSPGRRRPCLARVTHPSPPAAAGGRHRARPAAARPHGQDSPARRRINPADDSSRSRAAPGPGERGPAHHRHRGARPPRGARLPAEGIRGGACAALQRVPARRHTRGTPPTARGGETDAATWLALATVLRPGRTRSRRDRGGVGNLHGPQCAVAAVRATNSQRIASRPQRARRAVPGTRDSLEHVTEFRAAQTPPPAAVRVRTQEVTVRRAHLWCSWPPVPRSVPAGSRRWPGSIAYTRAAIIGSSMMFLTGATGPAVGPPLDRVPSERSRNARRGRCSRGGHRTHS
ncbi:hypothetical protein QJS66_18315 [Kocuria rhizophila]|nr:hypothetical protein QJS66_18315 [Kocuria rhizophila]